uniref:Hydrolase of the HAD superfamily-like protein n=1 Tax=Solibacter usitatus (strain Ellin6076) TaxID=234267 RepID=Q021R4_SOLUE
MLFRKPGRNVTPNPAIAKLLPEAHETLSMFVAASRFRDAGGVITDLDGTALHEDQGRIYIPKPVELGLKRLYDLGRPFVLNSLRFPLSILRTFGRDWYSISNAPIPTVSLNGSLLGYVTQNAQGEMIFEEIAAYPLARDEIDQALDSLEELLGNGIQEALLFYYPRDWRVGEVIWTPIPERVLGVKEKYVSASSVTAVELRKLRDQLHAEDICMMFLLLDIPEERLMAYQHTRRNSFFTQAGVDKLFGARQIAEQLHFDLASSIGAGDTELDRFLMGVGLAVLVGGLPLDFHGVHGTLRLKNSFELGNLLFEVANLLGENA